MNSSKNVIEDMNSSKNVIEDYIKSIVTIIRNATNVYLTFTILILVFSQCSKKAGNLPDTPDPSGVEITPNPGMDLYGYISDTSGAPVKDVVVSDGYTCTVTNSSGIYQMKKASGAGFVSYSTPAGYVVNTKSESVKMALFYAEISAVKRHDFTLKKLSAVETNFTLLCIGDPQVTSTAEIGRFETETMADIKAFTGSSATPCYGLAMGDMAGDKPALFDQMKTVIGSANMPVFTTIGNHDKVATSNANIPRTTDTFNKVFGPVNYSFNRGEVHFVCLDNVVYSNSSTYTGGFSQSQIDWLKQDLSYVPKNKMIVLFYHIPIRNLASVGNEIQLFNALVGYAEVHLMCGHTHYAENYQNTVPLITYEHIHAAACGAWWHSTINGDGTPNGYAVYDISGAKITNWYYKPTKLSKDFQIRLHKGNVIFGGVYGSFSFNQPEKSIVANVWNADSSWKIEAYEDGIKVANLTPLPTSLKDAWSLGYHIGILNRDPENYSTSCKHLYLHTVVNPNAALEIRATDEFGNVYRQNQIITDFLTAESY